MTTTAKDHATALARISALKMTQKNVLVALNAQAHAARLAGDDARARSLTQMSIKLSQQNLVIHRAKNKVLRAQDIGAVNSKLSAIVAQSDQILKDLNGLVDALTKAAEFIDLLRRTIAIFNPTQ